MTILHIVMIASIYTVFTLEVLGQTILRQTIYTLIRRHRMRRKSRVYTVCRSSSSFMKMNLFKVLDIYGNAFEYLGLIRRMYVTS